MDHETESIERIQNICTLIGEGAYPILEEEAAFELHFADESTGKTVDAQALSNILNCLENL